MRVVEARFIVATEGDVYLVAFMRFEFGYLSQLSKLSNSFNYVSCEKHLISELNHQTAVKIVEKFSAELK